MNHEKRLHTFSVLIVDDEPDVRQLLNIMLTKHHFNVYEASDGWEAIEFLQQQAPDLIIIDLLMPVMSGAELCDWIRQRCRDIPIMIVTCQSTPETQSSLLKAGADDYVIKPFRIKDFVPRVYALLLRSTSGFSSASGRA